MTVLICRDGTDKSRTSLKTLAPQLAIVMHIGMQQQCTLRIDVQGIPTIPSTLQEELDTNPFLRPDDPAIRKNLRKFLVTCHQRSGHACYDKLLFEYFRLSCSRRRNIQPDNRNNVACHGVLCKNLPMQSCMTSNCAMSDQEACDACRCARGCFYCGCLCCREKS